MTLPASGNISLTQVMAELRVSNPGRAYPLSLGDTDVRTLAGVASGPIGFGSLYGKGGYSPLSASGVNSTGDYSSSAGAGTAVCNPSVVPMNGNASKTFVWAFTSNPNACTLINSTSQTCGVTKGFAANSNGSANAVLQCTVNDGTTSVIVSGVTAGLSWSNT